MQTRLIRQVGPPEAVNGWLRLCDCRTSPQKLYTYVSAAVKENAALGVSGRRAPSSGSPLIMAVLLVVLLAILIRYCCFPALRQRGKRKGNVLG